MKINDKEIKEAFVLFATNNNYCSLAEVLIRSAYYFSQRYVILFCVDFDKPKYADKYPNLICSKIEWGGKHNIFYLKPKIIYDAMEKYGIEKGIYVEADDILTPNIDRLFNECNKIEKYPLCPIHSNEPNNQQKVMKILNVKNKSMHYVHGHIVFSIKCKNFIKEWYDTCIKLGNIKANWDETILNVLLWKYKVKTLIPYIYDLHYSHFFKRKIKSNTYMYHGCKDIKKAIYILKYLILSCSVKSANI